MRRTRTKNPAPTVTGAHATATLVEWIGLQECHTPKRLRGKYLDACEGDLDGVTYCWRHDMAWEHAQRLLRWQVRRPAQPKVQAWSPFCRTCRDTGIPQGDSFFSAAVGILYPTRSHSHLGECPDCPRCVVCSVEAVLHSESEEERCARELQETRELLPQRLLHHHWLPQLPQS